MAGDCNDIDDVLRQINKRLLWGGPSEQHEVVCNQCLSTECSRPSPLSSKAMNCDHTNGRFVLVTHNLVQRLELRDIESVCLVLLVDD